VIASVLAGSLCVACGAKQPLAVEAAPFWAAISRHRDAEEILSLQVKGDAAKAVARMAAGG